MQDNMAKTTKAHFELYKKHCLDYMDKYQLGDYSVVFEWKDTGNVESRCAIDGVVGNVTYCLSKEIPMFDRDVEKVIQDLAKHEVLHCLLGRYSNLASNRYISADELDSEEEHLIRKLMNICI